MARPPRKKAVSRKRSASAARKSEAAPIRRPSQVPASQWSKLGEASRKRYAGFFKRHPKGTIQQARGHRAGEAAERRSKLDQRIDDFAARQEARGARQGADADVIAEKIRARIRRLGVREGFTRLERRIDQLGGNYRAMGQPSGQDKTWERQIEPFDLAAEFDDDFDPWELFYH
jgi:hypothetical protein